MLLRIMSMITCSEIGYHLHYKQWGNFFRDQSPMQNLRMVMEFFMSRTNETYMMPSEAPVIYT